MAPRIQDPKRCTKCGELKPRTEYTKHAVAPNGVCSVCRPCQARIARERWAARDDDKNAIINRRSKIKRAYGITLEQYDEMLEGQDGTCAICGAVEPAGRHGRFAIDHCHATGKIRGLLCNMCNIGLGHFREDIGLMAKAIEYLASGGVQ